MSLRNELMTRRDAILAAARRRGATNVRIFDSIALDEDDAASDIDFLVDMEPGRSLLDLGGLQTDLHDLLGHPVDIATETGLRARTFANVSSVRPAPCENR